MAEYRLLDFGDGRKLEAIGDRVLDRPCPAAEGASKRSAQLWRTADSRFSKEGKREGWLHRTPWPEDLTADCGGFSMPVAPTPFGHIGLFPEQRDNWAWIRRFGRLRAERATGATSQDRVQSVTVQPVLRVLNLFAYTGASTIAAASSLRIVDRQSAAQFPGSKDNCGDLSVEPDATAVEVVHVDAAKPNVEAAKRGAGLNGLGESGDRQVAIRFLVDDARKFVGREIRRGRSYDLIVLDPPAYGHGAKGAAWRLERDLWPLLDNCLQLLNPGTGRDTVGRDAVGTDAGRGGLKGLLVTGHTAGCGPAEIRAWFRERAGLAAGEMLRREESGRAGLEDRCGRFLDAGFYVRLTWEQDQ